MSSRCSPCATASCRATRKLGLKFTAVSPNSRLIDRRAVATATQIGDTAYIFIVSAAAVKWKDEQDRVTAAARTFTAM